ncbi:hypothetical protein ACFWZK_14875 [[Kitasatospora] papulosa]|uniref:hypothetical protein n=1 Tax=Streptomyces TaxID=1883 RepID=UPI0033BEEA77
MSAPASGPHCRISRHARWLISVDDSGHGVYVLGNNSRTLNTTTRYLVKGRMPEAHFAKSRRVCSTPSS